MPEESGSKETQPTEVKPQETQAKAEQEQAEKQKPSELLQKTRSDVETGCQKISTLLKTASPEPETPLPSVSYSVFYSELDKFIQREKSLTSTEYLRESGQLIIINEQLKRQLPNEQTELKRRLQDLETRTAAIVKRATELESQGIIRRALSLSERSRLAKEKQEIKGQITEAEVRLGEKTRWAETFEKYYLKPFYQKQAEIISAEAEKEIQALLGKYVEFYNQLLKDGTITSEISEAFIQNTISPEIEIIQESWQGERGLNAEEKEQFYSDLRAYLAGRDKLDSDQLSQLFVRLSDNRFYRELEGTKLPLVNGDDLKILQRLAIDLSASDLREIMGKVMKEIERDYNWQRKAEDAFKKAFPTQQEGEWFEWDIHDFSILNFSMDLWDALKSSQTASEIFGDFIQEKDEKFYNVILDKSLGDNEGRFIDDLSYYPTPEAIRNLVLLAAAEYQTYRTVHANWTLTKLARKTNWKEILDEAQNKYPKLKNARSVLKKWKWGEYGSHPKIKKASVEFASSIFSSEQTDERIVALALESLPNSLLLDILIKSGLISEIEAAALKKADSLLGKISRKTMARGFRSPIESYFFQNALKMYSAANFKFKEKAGDPAFKRLIRLAQKINENKANSDVLVYLSSEEAVKLITTMAYPPETVEKKTDLLLGAYEICPGLKDSLIREILCEHYDFYLSEENLKVLNNLSNEYEDSDQLRDIATLVGKRIITGQRALELPGKIPDLLLKRGEFKLAVEFPEMFLATDEDVSFFRNVLEKYTGFNKSLRVALGAVKKGLLKQEFVPLFPVQAKLLMGKKNEDPPATLSFIFNHGNELINDVSDIKFLNSLAGKYGKKSDLLIREYQQCIEARVITPKEKELVLEFTEQFRVLSPSLLKGYIEAKQGGYEKVYLADLKQIAEKMTRGVDLTDEERAKPYHEALLKHIYPNNSGYWTSDKSNATCADRSGDLAQFKLEPRYEIDLLSAGEIRVRESETLDTQAAEELKAQILAISKKAESFGYDNAKMLAELDTEIEPKLKEVVEKGGLQGINLETLSAREEKLFLLLSDSTYGTKSISQAAVKSLLLTYEFATFEDIRDYIAGTSDRVGRASNQDYALLCELNTFFTDRIKEVNRRLVGTAWKNPSISGLMPEYFKRLTSDTISAERQELINRLQIDKLGAADSFVRQIGKTLESGTGKKYTPEQVRRIIHLYEAITGGLKEASTSKKARTRAFYGQLRSQREKTLQAIKSITGKDLDPKGIHLGEISLQQFLETQINIKEGKYDDEQFASYTVQRFINLFGEEKEKIETELAKFQSMSGQQREILYGYITKNKESANARMVGGVCVSGDNPSKGSQNMWDMPNYSQLVFYEPDTFQCQGLALLHHFTEDGKKILTVSLNPSSTYLYSVDETALFNGIMTVLERFAKNNNFDLIAFSQNPTIRTNRTGGTFGDAIKKRILKVNKTFKFSQPQQFSYSPNYQIQDMDVVWEK